jgi:hypothetical protein
LLYATYLGGNVDDSGQSIAVDDTGVAYVTGYAGSGDFPTTPGSYDPTGGGDAFAVKLNATGTALVYSTFLGGERLECYEDHWPCVIAIDDTGDAFVAGGTSSDDFPTTPGAFQSACATGDTTTAFVTKLNPAGSALLYSTCLGGGGSENVGGVVPTVSGSIYVSGSTTSCDFPVTPGAYDMTCNGSYDAFVVKLRPDLSALDYGTYLGGSEAQCWTQAETCRLAVDTTGVAYIAGMTDSPDFPTSPGAYDTTHNGNHDVFVTSLNPDGSALVYSTFVGGDWPGRNRRHRVGPNRRGVPDR